jgi:hypothetical protein
MKSPRHAPLPACARLASVTVFPLSVALLFSGCVSSKYRPTAQDTPPPQLINVAFAPAPLDASLTTVITYNGPGSWKRNAFWDEYVVTLRNQGKQTLVVTDATLADFGGTGRAAGGDPWALEKESKTLEQKYNDAGVAFVRYTAPGLVIAGTGVAVIAGAATWTTAGVAAAATIAVLPAYYVTVLTINHYNKVAMEKEFGRRRLVLPVTLAPGEARTGSFFFPMAPSPRSLALHWSIGTDSGDAILPLDFLHGLHVEAQSATAAKR